MVQRVAQRSAAADDDAVLLPLIAAFGWEEAAKRNHMRVETLAAIFAYRRTPAPPEPTPQAIANSWDRVNRVKRKKAAARAAANLLENERILRERVYEPWKNPDVDKMFATGTRMLSPSEKYSVELSWGSRHTGWCMESVVCIDIELMTKTSASGLHPSINYVVYDNGDGRRTQRLAVDDFTEPIEYSVELFAIQWEATHRKLARHIYDIAMARFDAEGRQD